MALVSSALSKISTSAISHSDCWAENVLIEIFAGNVWRPDAADAVPSIRKPPE